MHSHDAPRRSSRPAPGRACPRPRVDRRTANPQPCHWLAKRSGTMPSPAIRTARRNGCCPHERRTTAPPRRSLAARARPPAEGRPSQGQPSAETVAAFKGRVVSALGARTARWPHAGPDGVRHHTFASASAACSPSIFAAACRPRPIRSSWLLPPEDAAAACCCFFLSVACSAWCLALGVVPRRAAHVPARQQQRRSAAGRLCRPMAPVGSRSSESLRWGWVSPRRTRAYALPLVREIQFAI